MEGKRQVNILLDEEEYRVWKRVAKSQGRSLSNWVRWTVNQAFEGSDRKKAKKTKKLTLQEEDEEDTSYTHEPAEDFWGDKD